MRSSALIFSILFSVYASASQETFTIYHPPDSLDSSSGFAGPPTIGDVDDQDGTWAVAVDNNTDGAITVGFPAITAGQYPGTYPRPIALQCSSTYYVRQFDAGQTGDPQAQATLIDNGTDVSTGALGTVTSGTGQELDGTHGSSLCPTSESDVGVFSIRLNITKSGGSPSNRNTADVDRIWLLLQSLMAFAVEDQNNIGTSRTGRFTEKLGAVDLYNSGLSYSSIMGVSAYNIDEVYSVE